MMAVAEEAVAAKGPTLIRALQEMSSASVSATPRQPPTCCTKANTKEHQPARAEMALMAIRAAPVALAVFLRETGVTLIITRADTVAQLTIPQAMAVAEGEERILGTVLAPLAIQVSVEEVVGAVQTWFRQSVECQCWAALLVGEAVADLANRERLEALRECS